ncbi:MAG: lysophospholipid acyltransferase family protein [Spirochaetales bacterium]|nr:lysophospholipid acyltransferase family protein [Spirochaetales bacterium]
MKKTAFPVKIVLVLHRVFLAFFYLLLRLTVGSYIRLNYRLRYIKPEEVRRLRPPYLVLADHVHILDPFFNGMGLRPVIHWVAADANFRTPFMKFVMTVLAGAIAKTKNRSDMLTLSRMKFLARMGCVIGVYQEGERSWDGVNLPPVPGTDKLIRFLKIPVVYAHLEGAYLDQPRWSSSRNRGPITVRYERIIDRDEAARLSLSEIRSRMEKAGTYDEWALSREKGLSYKGETRAETCELVCFTCPGCTGVNTLRSGGNRFSCTQCGLEGEVDRTMRFQWHEESDLLPRERRFEQVRQWNLWQKDYYRRLMEEKTDRDYLFWEDRESVILSRGQRGSSMEDLGVVSARFYRDRIELHPSGEPIIMPLEEIFSFSVFKQRYVEFYYHRSLYRFDFTNPSVSGYKWYMLFKLISDFNRERSR